MRRGGENEGRLRRRLPFGRKNRSRDRGGDVTRTDRSSSRVNRDSARPMSPPSSTNPVRTPPVLTVPPTIKQPKPKSILSKPKPKQQQPPEDGDDEEEDDEDDAGSEEAANPNQGGDADSMGVASELTDRENEDSPARGGPAGGIRRRLMNANHMRKSTSTIVPVPINPAQLGSDIPSDIPTEFDADMPADIPPDIPPSIGVVDVSNFERPSAISNRDRTRSDDASSIDMGSVSRRLPGARLTSALRRGLKSVKSVATGHNRDNSSIGGSFMDDDLDADDERHTQVEVSSKTSGVSFSMSTTMQHAESFDSDNMLSHVLGAQPSPSSSGKGRTRQRKPRGEGGGILQSMPSIPHLPNLPKGLPNLPKAIPKALPNMPGIPGGRFFGNKNDDGSGSDAPIKKISFDNNAGISDTGSVADRSFTGTLSLASNLVSGVASGVGNIASGVTGIATGATGLATGLVAHSVRHVVGHRGRDGDDGSRYSGGGSSGGNRRKYRVRPYHCFPEPQYMSEDELYSDSTSPSQFFEFLKSYMGSSTRRTKKVDVREDVREKFGSPTYDGRIGSIRMEVLGCVSLSRSKPDVCVYCVLGDAAFCTDVIQGYRSPMWPSNSRRAAVFPIHHAYATIFVGIFDVRARKNKENDVFCGRVSIDIASLRPNTEYDITFPLRVSTTVYERHKRGVIRLRFSLHWFNERAAVLSYFSRPKTLLKTNPLIGGNPSIPCADPKTFRNVAVTAYGNDLPGKYSKLAFRATVREFILYEQNLRNTLKFLVLDAVMYERPYISLYLFLAGMHCIITESVTKVPPYFVGYLIIQFIENYNHFIVENTYNEGYRQLTLIEVAKALINTGGSKRKNFEPIFVTKRAKQRVNRRVAKHLRRIQSESNDGGADGNQESVPCNHREFPVSDRDAYPKLGVEHALAPSSKKGSGHERLRGRLSVYYAATPASETEGTAGDSADDDEESSDDDSEGDDATIMNAGGMGDNLFDDDDLDDMDDHDDHDDDHGVSSNSQYGYGEPMNQNQSSLEKHFGPRIKLGPPQNVDIVGKSVPPQVSLKRVENLMHKWTRSVSVEKISLPSGKENGGTQANPHGQHEAEKNEELVTETEAVEKQLSKDRKATLDEFDKLLGLQSQSVNPVTRLLASFLGPLQRMIRVPVFIFRVAFNAWTWRDPYLSFWILFCLVGIWFVLLFFPWRLFFMCVTIIGLGPQNIFLRKFIEKMAERRKQRLEKEKMEAAEAAYNSGRPHYGRQGSNRSIDTSDERLGYGSTHGSADGQARFPYISRGLANMPRIPRVARRGRRPSLDNNVNNTSGNNADFIQGERQPFSSDLYGISSSKRYRPRSVAIPYTRLRKERFYDWPPDPTVSKATPMRYDTMTNLNTPLGLAPGATPDPPVVSIPVDLSLDAPGSHELNTPQNTHNMNTPQNVYRGDSSM